MSDNVPSSSYNDSRKRSYQQERNSRRNLKSSRNKRIKLRNEIGVINYQNSLHLGLLNIDGLSNSSFEDVKSALSELSLDICVLLETKRRLEEMATDITVDGYTVHECRRSDAAGDKLGGGIAWYTRDNAGIVFKEYSPPISDPNLHFVQNERFWVTIDSLYAKTAVCGTYLGCQSLDDRHADWNESIYSVLMSESAELKSKGYRIILLGDFNGHVGSGPDGIKGNNPIINLNGHRLLNFLANGDFSHINGMSNLTTGLWTRQRGESRSVLDYAIVSNEYLHTVDRLIIDEKGQYGGGSDHNFLFLKVHDRFVKKQKVNRSVAKKVWNCLDSHDWTGFKEYITRKLSAQKSTDLSINQRASIITKTLLDAGCSDILVLVAS